MSSDSPDCQTVFGRVYGAPEIAHKTPDKSRWHPPHQTLSGEKRCILSVRFLQVLGGQDGWLIPRLLKDRRGSTLSFLRRSRAAEAWLDPRASSSLWSVISTRDEYTAYTAAYTAHWRNLLHRMFGRPRKFVSSNEHPGRRRFPSLYAAFVLNTLYEWYVVKSTVDGGNRGTSDLLYTCVVWNNDKELLGGWTWKNQGQQDPGCIAPT